MDLQKGYSPSEDSGCTPDCPRCGKPVFFKETVQHDGRLWHRPCFTCFNCGLALRENKFWFIGNTGRLECDRCAFRNKGRHLSYCLTDTGFPSVPKQAPVPNGSKPEENHCHNREHHRSQFEREQPYRVRPISRRRSRSATMTRKPPGPPPVPFLSPSIAAKANQIERLMKKSAHRRHRRHYPPPPRQACNHPSDQYSFYQPSHAYYAEQCARPVQHDNWCQRPPPPPLRPAIWPLPPAYCQPPCHTGHHERQCCPDRQSIWTTCEQCVDCSVCRLMEESAFSRMRGAEEEEAEEDDDEEADDGSREGCEDEDEDEGEEENGCLGQKKGGGRRRGP